METFAQKLFAQFPAPPPPDTEFATTQHITACKARYTYNQPTALDCYELVLTTSPFPSTRIGNRDYHIIRNRMFAINPGQVHYVHNGGPTPPYYPLFLERKLVSDVARDICGKESPSFNNAHIGLCTLLLQLTRMFIEEGNTRQMGQRLVMDCLSQQIVALMLRSLPNNLNIPTRNYTDRRSIGKAIEYMHSHYQDNFTLEQIAQAVNYSPYYFIRVFKNETGKTPFAYLSDLRIDKALELLTDSQISITEVCFACGFNNLSHFITVFKQKTGITPSCFQQKK